MNKPIATAAFYEVEAAHDYQIDLRHRELYVTGEATSAEGTDDGGEPGVEFQMASRLIRNLRTLSNRDASPILIHMKTSGGYWTEGMAMFDAIAQCPARVTILNYTHARSMSSIILQAADWRVMMPHSYFMFHCGTYGTSGDYRAVMSEVEFTKAVEEPAMLDIYVDALVRAGRERWADMKISQIRQSLKRHMERKNDVYLTAAEAVEWGFADEIFDGDWERLKRWDST
jgi:ATP-dependent protease ClpP protease subunit